ERPLWGERRAAARVCGGGGGGGSRNGRSAMTEPVTTLDPRYSNPAAAPTPWAVTCAALEAAELAWLVTLRQDGRPHATPVVPVWVDNSMHFTTGATEQKGKNLRDDDRVLLQVGGLDWQGGLDIAGEGRATLASDPAVVRPLGAAA